VRSNRHGKLLLNLLLFLSALLTGLTGAISAGQRADAPAVQQSIARAAEAVAESATQEPLAARSLATIVWRPIASVLGAKPGWVLTVDTRATDIGRMSEKLLI